MAPEHVHLVGQPHSSCCGNEHRSGPLGPTAAPAVRFTNVGVSLDGVKIIENVTATAPAGGVTAIIGPNGAGKTTLLLAMLRSLPYSGSITFLAGDQPISQPRLGYVPQRLDFDRGLPLTVLDLMLLGTQRWPLWLGRKRTLRDRAMRVLESVKADQLANRRVGALSGGELQRALLALALQEDPQLLILDEPAAGVDVVGENLLCELLEQLHHERRFTQIMVTHDLSLVTAHASHVICLNRRVLGCGPTRQTLTLDVLAATFGIHLGLADLQGASKTDPP